MKLSDMLLAAALLPLAACALDHEAGAPEDTPGGAAVAADDPEESLPPEFGSADDEGLGAPLTDPSDDPATVSEEGRIMEIRADGSRTIYRVNRDGAVIDELHVAATADTNDWEESQYQVVLTIYSAEKFGGSTYYFLTSDTNNVSGNWNFPSSFNDKMRSYVVSEDCKVTFYLHANQVHSLGTRDQTDKGAVYRSTTGVGETSSVRVSCGVTPQPRGFAYAASDETGRSFPFFAPVGYTFDFTQDLWGSWDTQISSYDLKVTNRYLLASTSNGGRYGVLGDITNLPGTWNDRTTRVRVEERDGDYLGCVEPRYCYTNAFCDPDDNQKVADQTYEQCRARHFQNAGQYRSYCNDLRQCLAVPGGGLQGEI